jgi:hypothetical protein
MTEFQKIAIGLLGLTHPEMFIARPAPARINRATDSPARGLGRGARIMRAVKFTLAALAIGSRTVPLGDNSELLHELSARASALHDASEC